MKAMSNKEILTKAIEKAIKGGWDWELIEPNTPFPSLAVMPLHKGIDSKGEIFGLENNLLAPSFIFDHSFAKALWGQEARINPYLMSKEERGGRFTGNAFEAITNKGWQRHLQEMVIAEDPIAYLGANI